MSDTRLIASIDEAIINAERVNLLVSARRWREAFDSMHRRAMDAEDEVKRLQMQLGQPMGYVNKTLLNLFNANGCEIVDMMIYPKGTLRPENEVAIYVKDNMND